MSQNAKPIIAWNNHAAGVGAVLTSSTEASGYPDDNVADWRVYTRWQGTGADAQWLKIDAGVGKTFAVSCFAIAGHDLHTQGVTGLVLQWSDNDADWTNCHTAIDPADDKPLFKSFTQVTHRYFRLLIPAGYTSPPQIGIFFIGPYMQFPSWPGGRFDPDERTKKFSINRNCSGQLTGAEERYTELSIRAEFSMLTPSWVADNLIPFYRDHVPQPFFWIWDETNHSDEVYLCALPAESKLSLPMGPSWRSFSLEMIGVAE